MRQVEASDRNPTQKQLEDCLANFHPLSAALA